MNRDTLTGSWHIAKGKLKQRFAHLTDDDLSYVAGQEEELFGRLQRRTGQTRDQLERVLDQEAEETRD